MPSDDLHEAEDALGLRLAADGELGTLVGSDESGDVRVYGAWPDELLTNPVESEFPRITYFRASDDIMGVQNGVPTVREQIDLWVWPEGDEGGALRLRQIRTRAFTLLGGRDGTWWTYGTARIDCVILPGGAERPGRPLRYTFDVEIGVS